MYNLVKRYYDNGLWSVDRVWSVVGKAITEEDYTKITGFVYPAKS
jgi:hypothetical protein